MKHHNATINKVIDFLNKVIDSPYNTIYKYCKANNEKSSYWYNIINKTIDNPVIKDLYIELADKSKTTTVKLPASNTEPNFEDIAQDTEWVKDKDDKIIGYKFNIKRKVGGPLIGTLSRTQMDTLCSLYSRYGADLTVAQTSLDFPEYSLDEINRIKRAFLIYKYSCPFAPHEVDEHTEEELHNIAIERKKNNLTRTLEKNQLKDAQKINLQLVDENTKLKNFQKYITNLNINISDIEDYPVNIPANPSANMILNIADVHIGATVESNSLYTNSWTEEDIHNRLLRILNKLESVGIVYNTIYLNMLGDMLDGMDNQTARRDHFMPQDMDNYKQFDVFFRQFIWFIKQLKQYCTSLNIYSVPNGNHTGAPEYIAMIALQQVVNNLKNVTMEVFNTFLGYYSINDHCIIICHGKDAKFMKKPLPLHLDSTSIVWLNNYMDRMGITHKYKPGKIHIFKGDLHSASYDSNLKFDYRNCLSLFGDSDYSQMNYNSNPRGCSYSLLIGDNIINGDFII